MLECSCGWKLNESDEPPDKCPECGTVLKASEQTKQSNRRSGRSRKSRRRARKNLSRHKKRIQGELVEKAPVWGLGGEREERRNNRLVSRSIRWNTDSTSGDFAGKSPEELKARDIALLVTRKNMLSQDATTSNQAVRNLISMEKQNQDDDKKESVSQQHLHIHANPDENPYMHAPIEDITDALIALERLEENSEEAERDR